MNCVLINAKVSLFHHNTFNLTWKQKRKGASYASLCKVVGQ